MSDPADQGVLEAAKRLRARELSAAELLAACLRRIEERNGGAPSFDGAPGAINAWARLYPELAAEQARAADERRPVAALPAGVGRRSGLPVGVSLIAPRGAEAPLVQAAIDLQEHALPYPGPTTRP